MNENKGKLCLEEITEKLQNTIRKFNEKNGIFMGKS